MSPVLPPDQQVDADDTGVSAVNFARALQLTKEHGVTVLILVLLAYQMGIMGNVQSEMCGI